MCVYLLSFYAAATALTHGYFIGVGMIWLDDVQCIGNETRLIDCPANVPGVHDCLHSADVGVACSATTCAQGAIRLVGGRNNLQGIIEICSNNIWGRVCTNIWSTADAEVTCRQLGFRYTSKSSATIK